MENQNIEAEGREESENVWKNIEKSHRRGKIMGGVLIVAIGSLFLARELGAEIPFWVFSWKMLLIGLGVVSAVKHRFLHPGWMILIAVGGAFLLSDLYPHMQIKPILWPSLIILFGLAIIFKPRRKSRFAHYRKHFKKRNYEGRYPSDCGDRFNCEEPTSDNYLESTVLFAGVKKIVLAKNFKGGEVVNVFGGTELNLSQADFEGTAKLEITQVFGGTKLIVPSHWEVRSEQTVTVFGNVEDKRGTKPPVAGEPDKVLIITGTTVFGGIDIRSF